MKKYFKGIDEQKDNGFFLASFGCSSLDDKDYCLTTEMLKADEIPEACCDAKTNSQLVAGLLNAFYNKIDVINWDEERVISIGMPNEERKDIPSELNPTIPF